MLEWGILFLSGILFLGCVVIICTVLTQFSHMKAAAMLMEAAFKEGKTSIDETRVYVGTGLNRAEEQYASVIDEYAKVLKSNNALQQRINQMEASQKKPMAPDVTFN